MPAIPEGPPYGRACGIVGVDPQPRTVIETLIHCSDTTRILNWLHDSDLVYQAYAAEALIRLERSGMVIPPAEKIRLEKLKKSKRMVYVCSGCSHWYEEIGRALMHNVSVNNIR